MKRITPFVMLLLVGCTAENKVSQIERQAGKDAVKRIDKVEQLQQVAGNDLFRLDTSKPVKLDWETNEHNGLRKQSGGQGIKLIPTPGYSVEDRQALDDLEVQPDVSKKRPIFTVVFPGQAKARNGDWHDGYFGFAYDADGTVVSSVSYCDSNVANLPADPWWPFAPNLFQPTEGAKVTTYRSSKGGTR